MGEPATKSDILKLLAKDPLLFGKIVSPNAFSVNSPDFHKELAQMFIDPAMQKVNVIASRGHAKSTLVAGVFVLHHLMFSLGQKLVVLVSKTEGHATRLLQTIKDILDFSAGFRALFGYYGEHTARVWKQAEIVTKDNDMIIARGTGQMVVGLKYGNQRPTLIIGDDLEDMNNTKTVEAMEFNLRWVFQSLVPSLDPLKGRIWLISTPQHQRCICETVKGMTGWITKVYPALRNEKGEPDPNGQPLWPEWWSREKLIEEKNSYESIGRISMFYREFLCRIIGDEDQLFREDDLRFYDGTIEHNSDGEPFLQFSSLHGEPCDSKIPVSIYMGVDPASSTEERADSTAIVIVAVDEHHNRYVLDVVNKRMKPMDVANEILYRFVKWNPSRTRIESNAYQEMLRDYLRTVCEERGMFIPGLEIKEVARDKKDRRLESMQPLFAQHKVHLRKDQHALNDQLVSYPKGGHEDILDALFYACKHNSRPHHTFPVQTIVPKNSTEYLLCEYTDAVEDDDLRLVSTAVDF